MAPLKEIAPSLAPNYIKFTKSGTQPKILVICDDMRSRNHTDEELAEKDIKIISITMILIFERERKTCT